jgi:RNA-directed DNA polymerase
MELEQRASIEDVNLFRQPKGMIMKDGKSIEISKELVWASWKRVKSNAGSAGIDEQSIADFESDLEKQLYKVWNRLSSGCYFPPPIKAVEIPKRSGGKRRLGIPNVADRVAQTAIKALVEPRLEAVFAEDSYGYRPGRSAHDALGVTRKRCWQYDWVLEYDIKGLFDNLSHDLLLKAIEHHIKEKWIVMYIERWLKAPMILGDGKEMERTCGTPQGGVISPVLANLFLHYAIDAWSERALPGIPWCRYADDGLFHCNSRSQAEYVLQRLTERLRQCKLEIHPTKTRIVYCHDDNRKARHEHESFVFLGLEFRARSAENKQTRKVFRSFGPALGKDRLKELRYRVKHELRILNRTDLPLEDLANEINPVIMGWLNYYGKFQPSAMRPLAYYIDTRLARWARKKYKKLNRSVAKSRKLIVQISDQDPGLFAHWHRYRPLMGAV